jgi:starch phosphorylase
VARVRESMANLTPIYSANRSVREYVERCCLPAAASYRRRAKDNGALGIQMSVWRKAIGRGWPTLHFGRVAVDTRGDRHHVTVEVELGTLNPKAVRVELYADPLGANHVFSQEMTRLGRAEGALIDLYSAKVPAIRAAGDYTARIVPNYPGVDVPLEAPNILWQRWMPCCLKRPCEIVNATYDRAWRWRASVLCGALYTHEGVGFFAP